MASYELIRIEQGEEELIRTGSKRAMEAAMIEELDEAEGLVENGEQDEVPEYRVVPA
jgi:hypothetical protein